MTTLREVVAEALTIASGQYGATYNQVTDAVLAAIFDPENREALREEALARGAGFTAAGGTVLGPVSPDSSAGSGGAG